jgi:hypothetical protein
MLCGLCQFTNFREKKPDFGLDNELVDELVGLP